MILRFIYCIIGFVLGSALKRILVGAGLAIVSSQIILSIINVYINKALSGMSTGASSAMAFLGLSGADVLQAGRGALHAPRSGRSCNRI